MKKRVLTILLVAMMVLALLPTNVFAVAPTPGPETFSVKNKATNPDNHGAIELSYFGQIASLRSGESADFVYSTDPDERVQVTFVPDATYTFVRDVEVSDKPDTENPTSRLVPTTGNLTLNIHPQWGGGEPEPDPEITFNLGAYGLYDITLYPTLTNTRTETIAIGGDVNEPQLGVDFYDGFPLWRFTGWDKSVVNPVTGSATYNAVYQEYHQITYDLDGHATYNVPGNPTLAMGTIIDGGTLVPGDFPVEGSTMDDFTVESGWVFTGWLPTSLGPITGPTTYTAQYVEEEEPVEYTLTVTENITGAGAFRYKINDGPYSAVLYGGMLTAYPYTITGLELGDVVTIMPYAFPGFDRDVADHANDSVAVTITVPDQEEEIQ